MVEKQPFSSSSYKCTHTNTTINIYMKLFWFCLCFGSSPHVCHIKMAILYHLEPFSLPLLCLFFMFCTFIEKEKKFNNKKSVYYNILLYVWVVGVAYIIGFVLKVFYSKYKIVHTKKNIYLDSCASLNKYLHGQGKNDDTI